MQIKSATKEELGLLIQGLQAISVMDRLDLQEKLLDQLKNELLTRYGLTVRAA